MGMKDLAVGGLKDKGEKGSRERPLSDGRAMTVARAFAQEVYGIGEGKKGLWALGSSGEFLAWCGGKWCHRSRKVVENDVWRWMEDLWSLGGKGDGSEVRRVPAGKDAVAEVTRALEVVCESPWIRLPCWAGNPGAGAPMPAETCVGFQDVVASVHGGAVRTVPRDEKWLDTVVLPCDYEREAPCPRWMRALEEWGRGDPKWAGLLQRWMGLALITKRDYRKWMLMQGKTQGGKGVVVEVMRMLVGDGAWFTVSVHDLQSAHAMAGVQHARVMNVPEFSQADREGRNRFSGLWKQVVGRDPTTINEKYAQQQRVVINALPMMQSNPIPLLCNENEGLSSKMLVLPFTRSFAGTQQFDLVEELRREVAGIAAWAVEGARMVEEEGGRVWPEPERAAEVRFRFRMANHPMDSFLESRFEKVEGGFVSGDLIRREWKDWVRANGVRELAGVAMNQVMFRLESESTWPIARGRKVVGDRHIRGLVGLGLKKVRQDEV